MSLSSSEREGSRPRSCRSTKAASRQDTKSVYSLLGHVLEHHVFADEEKGRDELSRDGREGRKRRARRCTH